MIAIMERGSCAGAVMEALALVSPLRGARLELKLLGWRADRPPSGRQGARKQAAAVVLAGGRSVGPVKCAEVVC